MVRYHNSGTQKFDDTEHDSVNTADVTIGSASVVDGGPVGSSGEFMPLYSIDGDLSHSVSNTSFTQLTSISNRVLASFAAINLTNIGDLYVSYVATIDTPSDAEATFRIKGANDTAVTVPSGSTNVFSSSRDIETSGGVTAVNIEGRLESSSTGSATIDEYSILVWGEIK